MAAKDPYIGRDRVEATTDLPRGAVWRAGSLLIFWTLLGSRLIHRQV